MQASPENQEPVTVILDCEIGRRVDNALAMALLHGLSKQAKPEAKFAAVSLTRSSLQSAAYCDAVGRFYSTAWLRQYPERFRRYRGFAPGLDTVDALGPSAALAAALDKKTPDGEAIYPHEVQEIFDTADPVALIRNAMTAETDGGCAVVLAGCARNLAALLDLNGALDLIQAKVRTLVVAMDQEHVLADLPAARKLFAHWPGSIVAVRPTDLRFPAEVEYGWTDNHPVDDALRASGGDGETSALAAALYAVRPQMEGFELSEPGRIVVDDGGQIRLEGAPSGQHHLLGAEDETLLRLYREIITAEPAPREPPDFIKRAVEQEKEESQK
jgi:hypothetical protein